MIKAQDAKQRTQVQARLLTQQFTMKKSLGAAIETAILRGESYTRTTIPEEFVSSCMAMLQKEGYQVRYEACGNNKVDIHIRWD